MDLGDFSPFTLAVFHAWGRITGTGRGNQSPLVSFKSARLEQRGGMLIFSDILKVLLYSSAIFPHWH